MLMSPELEPFWLADCSEKAALKEYKIALPVLSGFFEDTAIMYSKLAALWLLPSLTLEPISVHSD